MCFDVDNGFANSGNSRIDFGQEESEITAVLIFHEEIESFEILNILVLRPCIRVKPINNVCFSLSQKLLAICISAKNSA